MTAALPVPASPPTDEVVAMLARRYLGAAGPLMQVVTLAGGQVEGVVNRLPAGARGGIETAVNAALAAAYGAAARSHGRRASGERAHRLAAAALGVAGGAGGLPSAIAELPVTTTALLRSIQEIARHYGEDPGDPATRLEALRVLGSGGPLAEDDGTDFAFLGARLALTGPALQKLIVQIAPRFAAVLGQKLALQAVPLLGAAAGAAVNLAFARYYQEMAHVHFGLRRLSRDGRAEALPAFRAAVETARAVRRA